LSPRDFKSKKLEIPIAPSSEPQNTVTESVLRRLTPPQQIMALTLASKTNGRSLGFDALA